MNIVDFNDYINLDEVVLLEIKAGFEVPLSGWNVSTTGSTYWLDLSSYKINEIVELQENGVPLTRVFTEADCAALLGSYYHDVESEILYINSIETGGIPGDTGLFFMAFCWLGITNKQSQDDIISFVPQNAIYPILYEPFLMSGSSPAITQKVANYSTVTLTMQIGGLSFLNDGWWYEKREIYNFHNKEAYIKIGEKGSAYSDYSLIFPGITQTPKISDTSATLELKDKRAEDLKSVPDKLFSYDNYPYLEDDALEEPIPVLLGEKTGIVPTLIDEVNFTYKITRTDFDGIHFDQEEIITVWQDGVEIYEDDDYTVDLTNGEFSLINDPQDTLITVRAKGLKCSYDFTQSAYWESTGTYTDNVADLLFFILYILNKIPAGNIDASSLHDLQTTRTQRLGIHLATTTSTTEILKKMQSSCVFHMIPSGDGIYIARYYDRTTPADSMRFQYDDLEKFKIDNPTKTAFSSILLRYDQNPSEDKWETVSLENVNTKYKHGVSEPLKIDTYLISETEAQTAAEFFLNLIDDPEQLVGFNLNAVGYDLIPTDKIVISREVTKSNNSEIVIYENEVFVVMSVTKQLSRGKTPIIALLDSQAGGTGLHSDVAHLDHQDDLHDDAAHADVAHGDASYNDHDDTPHVNIAGHDDTYADHDDSTTPYQDHQDDVWHQDIPLKHTDHDDNPHDNVAHDDVAHTDHDDNSHTDTPHENGHDDYTYTDHEDVAHIDSYL